MTENNQKSKLEAEIDQNLRKVYDDVANEPLPARFADLLDQLRTQDKARTSTHCAKGDDSNDQSA